MSAGVARLTSAILKGVEAALFADALNRMGRRKSELEHEVQARKDDATPALLDPRLAQMYRHKVEHLLEAFESEARRNEAEEVIGPRKLMLPRSNKLSWLRG